MESVDLDRVAQLEQELAGARKYIDQHKQALTIARELLGDYQNRHEAAEQSWARACQHLQARSEFLEARVRAFDAFQLPGAEEILQLSKQVTALARAPEPLDSQTFTERLDEILAEI